MVRGILTALSALILGLALLGCGRSDLIDGLPSAEAMKIIRALNSHKAHSCKADSDCTDGRLCRGGSCVYI